jgi:hypothetical protein
LYTPDGVGNLLKLQCEKESKTNCWEEESRVVRRKEGKEEREGREGREGRKGRKRGKEGEGRGRREEVRVDIIGFSAR